MADFIPGLKLSELFSKCVLELAHFCTLTNARVSAKSVGCETLVTVSVAGLRDVTLPAIAFRV